MDDFLDSEAVKEETGEGGGELGLKFNCD